MTTYTDRNGVVWTVTRSDANPRWWVAVHPDGWLCHGVDATTRGAALAQLRDLDARNIL
jgi:hypothetical protein